MAYGPLKRVGMEEVPVEQAEWKADLDAESDDAGFTGGSDMNIESKVSEKGPTPFTYPSRIPDCHSPEAWGAERPQTWPQACAPMAGRLEPRTTTATSWKRDETGGDRIDETDKATGQRPFSAKVAELNLTDLALE